MLPHGGFFLVRGQVKYSKKALNFDEQAALLQARGMLGDHEVIKRRLGAVNYYRLSAYWHPFKDQSSGDERFLAKTHIDVIWDRYIFDRALTVLVMDALERFEIAVRTRIAYELAMETGPFGYSEDRKVLYERDPRRRAEFLQRLEEDLRQRERSEKFVEHFVRQYGDAHDHPPIWVAVEVLSFGGTFTLFNGCRQNIQKRVARAFDVGVPVLESWLRTLNDVRNVCAHHGRLWNRVLGNKPKIPYGSDWHGVGNDRIFGVLSILSYILTIVAPRSQWRLRVKTLTERHPDVPLEQMGFPKDWGKLTLWAPS